MSGSGVAGLVAACRADSDGSANIRIRRFCWLLLLLLADVEACGFETSWLMLVYWICWGAWLYWLTEFAGCAGCDCCCLVVNIAAWLCCLCLTMVAGSSGCATASPGCRVTSATIESRRGRSRWQYSVMVIETAGRTEREVHINRIVSW